MSGGGAGSGPGAPINPVHGKYRGKVLSNLDPLFLGRIQAETPAFPNTALNWCMPCSPYAGRQVGFYAIPPIGANVWIEFEGGDINFPIWAGCFWGEAETPFAAPEPPNPLAKIFKTDFMTLVLNDTPEAGGVTLTCLPPAVATPLSMTFNSLGITISALPAVIKMSPEIGITLQFPPGSTAMTEAGVTIAVTPASSVTITPAAVNAVAPTIGMTAEGVASLTGGADVNVTAEGAANVQAGAALSLKAGAAATMTAGGEIAITGTLVLIN